jgi:leader peptidase (prepilin peptidase) / N-methyltransferase
MVALAVIAFVAGLVVGSFVNVVAHRLPLGQSIVRPRSRCPHCGETIAAYDNVPVVSWLVLRGRCRHCGEPISPRYPLTELAGGLLFAGTYLRFPDDPELWLGLALVTMLLTVTVTDLEHRIIPNRVLLPGAVAGVAIVAAIDPSDLGESAIAAAAAGGFLLLVVLAYPRGMGMGDVKLAAVMGIYLGRAIAPAMLVGFAAGAIVGVAIMVRRGASARKQAVPFGPFLALGGLVGLYAGDQIVDWYLDTFING